MRHQIKIMSCLCKDHRYVDLRKTEQVWAQYNIVLPSTGKGVMLCLKACWQTLRMWFRYKFKYRGKVLEFWPPWQQQVRGLSSFVSLAFFLNINDANLCLGACACPLILLIILNLWLSKVNHIWKTIGKTWYQGFTAKTCEPETISVI